MVVLKVYKPREILCIKRYSPLSIVCGSPQGLTRCSTVAKTVATQFYAGLT